MAFVAAATSVGAAVLGTGAAAGIGSTIVGGALIGAGVGGLYSAVTGDGNILNSMLTGGLIGGAAGGIGGAIAPQAAGYKAAALPSTAAVPTSNVVTGTAAQKVAAQQAAANAANLEALALAEGSTTAGMVPAANTGLAANTTLPASMTFTQPATQAASGLTRNQVLGYGLAGSAALSLLGNRSKTGAGQPPDPGMIRPYEFASSPTTPTGQYPAPYATTQYNTAGLPVLDTRERNYFNMAYEPLQPYSAKSGTPNPNVPVAAASGGLMAYGGPVERMSAMDQQRGMYPMGMIDKTYYATPYQRPASMEVVRSDYDTPVNPITGLQPMGMAQGGEVKRMFGGGMARIIARLMAQNQDPALPTYEYNPANQQYTDVTPQMAERAGLLGLFGQLDANRGYNLPTYSYSPDNQTYQQMAAGGSAGGEYNLGSYSDGGRLLKGPGDGMSDNIPATIGKKQPARLADGEFVIPADVVSHLGNGSTDAGAKRLYAMMDKVRKARTGNKKQGKEIKAEKYLPA